MEENLITIGISGVTCGGKTTLATNLAKLLHNNVMISQDDYFLGVQDQRHTWITSLHHINFDILSSLDMERMHSDVLKVIKGSELIGSNDFNFTNNLKNETKFSTTVNNLRKEINQMIDDKNLKIIIIEGFCIYNYAPLLPVFNLKYYFTLSKEECFKRRSKRVYDPPDCPGYFEECAWPEHLKQLDEIKTNVKDVKYFGEISSNILEQVLTDVLELLR